MGQSGGVLALQQRGAVPWFQKCSFGGWQLYLSPGSSAILFQRSAPAREHNPLAPAVGLPDRSVIGSVYIELGCEALGALILSVPISIVLIDFLERHSRVLWLAVETYLNLKGCH